MIIEVKEEDWRNHLQKLNDKSHYYPPSENCPISWALRRSFGVEYAQITYNLIRVGMFPDNIIFCTNVSVQVNSWLKHYDCDPQRHFTPFQFELDLPSDIPIS